MDEFEPPVSVLCVGGTDPTGAAGLLLDMKILGAVGVLGAGVVTAVTVQSSEGVSDVVPIPASVVGAQLDAAILERPPATIKTGMLHSVDTVLAVATRIERLGSRTSLVVDPVLWASSGRRLLDSEGTRALLERLLPRAALVTPNVPEAKLLTGVSVHDVDAMDRAAELLLSLGAGAVLVKGGHLPEEASPGVTVDLLRTLDGDRVLFETPRLAGPGFRGTGCFLATAIAAGLAEGRALVSSIRQAKRLLEESMLRAVGEPPALWPKRPLTLVPTPRERLST